MKPYAERQVFEPHVLQLWKRATDLVSMLPTWWCRDPADGSWQAVRTSTGAKELRCHEVARVIGRRLVLEVRDGQYGGAEHSWLEIPGSPFVILDTYACGRMPQVQLVDRHAALPELKSYVVGPKRNDIRLGLVDAIIGWLEERDIPFG